MDVGIPLPFDRNTIQTALLVCLSVCLFVWLPGGVSLVLLFVRLGITRHCFRLASWLVW